jgi:hypothetical protein
LSRLKSSALCLLPAASPAPNRAASGSTSSSSCDASASQHAFACRARCVRQSRWAVRIGARTRCLACVMRRASCMHDARCDAGRSNEAASAQMLSCEAHKWNSEQARALPSVSVAYRAITQRAASSGVRAPDCALHQTAAPTTPCRIGWQANVDAYMSVCQSVHSGDDRFWPTESVALATTLGRTSPRRPGSVASPGR